MPAKKTTKKPVKKTASKVKPQKVAIGFDEAMMKRKKALS